MLRTFQLDEKGQERLVAALCMAVVQLENPPHIMGRGSVAVFNGKASDVLAASMAILMGGKMATDIFTMSVDVKQKNLTESADFLQKLVDAIANPLIEEEEANARV